MSRMRLLNHLLPDGSNRFEGFCIIKNVAVKQNKNGTDYLDLILADADGEGVAKLWDYNRETLGEFAPNDIIKVRGVITLFKDAEQLKIEKMRKPLETDVFDMNDLMPCCPFDPEWLYDELYTLAKSFNNSDLRRIVTYLMDENKEKLLYWPAAVKLHHATRGGLLHHSWSIVELAKKIVEIYPALNGELIYAGSILHDIGKLRELEASSLGIAGAYSAEGQLIGHINIGIIEIAKVSELLGIGQETEMLLEHMLLSHHGEPEFGSPKYPMFPEAEVLSELDLMDSRLYEMFTALDGIQPHGFTERQWALDNRQLYNHCLNNEKGE